MFRKKRIVLLPLALAALALLLATGEEAQANRGDGALGVVYVRSQNLYYDTFVTAQQLPPHGPFQLLENGATDYGPGDRHYVGGRWKVKNDNGGYDYFLCPLLGPGRATP
jgi:hypothetical protein